METLLGSSKALRQCTARALDVSPRPVVTTLEEDDTRPYVDRLLVLTCEIVIEPREEELFNARLAIGIVGRVRGANRSGRRRIRHVLGVESHSIIEQNSSWVNELQSPLLLRRPAIATCRIAVVASHVRRWGV